MLTGKNDIKKIIVFRALQLGDMLCSIPAFRALRGAFAQARIVVTGLPWMKILPERFNEYFDEFIWFPGYPGLPEQPFDAKATADFLQQVVARQFDLAIQMQGNGSVVNPLVESFGAPHTAGFYVDGHYFPDNGLFMRYPEGISEIHRHLRLMNHLGINTANDHLEFPILPQDEDDFANADLGLEMKKYVCVHPGSRGGWRQWPPEHFARLASRVSSRGHKIVLTGTADELPIINQVAGLLDETPVIAAGRTTLGALAVLLKNARGLISNCTGVSHMAAALRTPSIVISMDGEPERWAPLNTSLHHTFDWTKKQDTNAIQEAVDAHLV